MLYTFLENLLTTIAMEHISIMDNYVFHKSRTLHYTKSVKLSTVYGFPLFVDSMVSPHVANVIHELLYGEQQLHKLLHKMPYWAGFFDSDGSISVNFVRSAGGKKYKYTINPRLNIAQMKNINVKQGEIHPIFFSLLGDLQDNTSLVQAFRKNEHKCGLRKQLECIMLLVLLRPFLMQKAINCEIALYSVITRYIFTHADKSHRGPNYHKYLVECFAMTSLLHKFNIRRLDKPENITLDQVYRGFLENGVMTQAQYDQFINTDKYEQVLLDQFYKPFRNNVSNLNNLGPIPSNLTPIQENDELTLKHAGNDLPQYGSFILVDLSKIASEDRGVYYDKLVAQKALLNYPKSVDLEPLYRNVLSAYWLPNLVSQRSNSQKNIRYGKVEGNFTNFYDYKLHPGTIHIPMHAKVAEHEQLVRTVYSRTSVEAAAFIQAILADFGHLYDPSKHGVFLQYLAGWVDADGSITITPSHTEDILGMDLSPRLQLTQKSPDVLLVLNRILSDIFPHSDYVIHNPKNKGKNSTNVIYVRGRAALVLMVLLRPYIKTTIIAWDLTIRTMALWYASTRHIKLRNIPITHSQLACRCLALKVYDQLKLHHNTDKRKVTLLFDRSLALYKTMFPKIPFPYN